MNARFDDEVMWHLNELYREHLRHEAAQLSARGVTRLVGDASSSFLGASGAGDFADEEHSQPRRLSLRVF